MGAIRDEKPEVRLSIRQMNKFVKRIGIKSHDVIVVRENTDMATKDNIDALAEAIGKSGAHGVILIVAEELDDIKAINEDKMREHGWVKVGASIAKLLKDKDKKDDEKDDSVQPS